MLEWRSQGVAMDLQWIRAQIPTTQNCIYLNTGWSGPSPRPVLERIKDYLELEASLGPASIAMIEIHEQTIIEARGAAARIVNASPEEIALVENTTEGINLVLNGLPWQEGDEVVTCDLEHSSGLVPCYFLQKRHGVKVRVVKLEDAQDAETILGRLEESLTHRTRLLCLSHIMYCNGLRLPLREIQEMARERGALLLVDGAQSVGQIEVDVKALGCDFYAFPGHKWLLGPEGVGALYIRRELIESLQPAKVAFWAVSSYDHEGNFTPITDSIRKFELTTQSIALQAGFAEAVRFLEQIGQNRIESRIMQLASDFRDKLSQIPGVMLHGPEHPELASGLVSFSLQGLDAEAVTGHLWDRYRIAARSLEWPASTRLSLEFFNTEEELEQTLQAIGRLAREGIPS